MSYQVKHSPAKSNNNWRTPGFVLDKRRNWAVTKVTTGEEIARTTSNKKANDMMKAIYANMKKLRDEQVL